MTSTAVTARCASIEAANLSSLQCRGSAAASHYTRRRAMGISRDNWHKRRKTGGKRKPYHKKRKRSVTLQWKDITLLVPWIHEVHEKAQVCDRLNVKMWRIFARASVPWSRPALQAKAC
ncbi:hypothetical protein Celaphus_00008875 [Cervus elaphus hippelaphus]|uniref:Uncharacterized protein n=1 Tax=Cervus elaphus hippelaphus TaxID=46360 RepID=A0A212DIU2_CEREH|nr:hypothetical protein Celaphus_00008875 [Cervus elaphus hippelaphus]